MGRQNDDGSVCEVDRLRADYLAAYDGGDLETALRIGTDRLVPLSERLAVENEGYHDQLGMTLRNLALISYRLGRRVDAFYFMQRAFHSAMLLDERSLPMDRSLGSAGTETVEFAADLVGGYGSGRSAKPERELITPAASLVPTSIELMGRTDSIEWASRMRVAASVLRVLGPNGNPDLLDYESRSMVWLARIGLEHGNRDLALGEIREALSLWAERADAGRRYWSSRLERTWTVAADLLESLSLHQSAASIRQGHYRAALAALPAR